MKILSASLFLACITGAHAVTLMQVDNFTSDTEGWIEGNPSSNPPTFVATGGPDGGSHLQNLATGGGGPGSRLVMWNDAQWTGDYMAAGVTGINLFADNRGDLVGGTDTIHLRIAFNGPGGWFATDPIALPEDVAGADWQPLSYSIGMADLTHVSGGTGAFADTMGAVTRMQILADEGAPNSVGSIIRGDVINTDFRIDAITAVPEPGSLTLLGFGAALLMRRRRP